MMDNIVVNKVVLHRFKKYRDRKIKPPSGFCILAGSNNSGKTTFMQSLALWEYCKSVIVYEAGQSGLTSQSIGKRQGVGINSDDFLPLNLPSLKHLWTNLRVSAELDDNGNKESDGYTLWIEVIWNNLDIEGDRYLRFSLSLANERIFVKATKSNISEDEILPKIAYIPPFAGILNREPLHTKAMRARLIGQGLSGSVMRNTLLDLFKENQIKRDTLKGELTRIPKKSLNQLRDRDEWEHLQEIFRNMFNIELFVHDFSQEYHSYIKVEYWKGDYNSAKTKFIKRKGFNRRDIMVEGSGFLQLLNVVALALDPSYHVIFLDEPDAHLHPSLQFQLLDELQKLSKKYGKQILFATHSTELIASTPLSQILKFEGNKIKTINEEAQKTRLITGLGSEYTPDLHKLQRSEKIVFVEGDSDTKLLQIFSERLETPINNDVVIWKWSGSHSERLNLFIQLKSQFKNLKGLSLRDRDNADYNSVTESLKDKGYISSEGQGLEFRTWRFRYIETYLLLPSAIARATLNYSKEQVIKDARLFQLELTDYKNNEIPWALRELPSKPILSEGKECLTKKYGITKYNIAKVMHKKEIHIDIKKIVKEINSL